MSRQRPRKPVRLVSFLPRLEQLECREVPATIVVDSTLDNVANDGVTTLREAIDQANTQAGDDTITFDAKLTAGGPATITLDSALPALTSFIEIDGPGAKLLTVTRNAANGSFGIFAVSGGPTVGISGLTITGGQAVAGGGLLVDGSSLVLTECAVTNNEATDSGGGLAIINGAGVVLERSTLSGNLAGNDGGAVDNAFGALTLNDCTVSGSSAGNDGGGIRHGSGAFTTLTSVTLTNNRADSDASGAGAGGGIFLADVGATSQSSIVAGNFDGTGTTAGDIEGPATLDMMNSKFNLTGTGGSGGLFNGFGGNQTGVADAGLLPLGDYGGPTLTHALKPTSVAIDKGNNFLGVDATDQRDLPRSVRVTPGFFGDGTDVGAFEHQGVAVIHVNSTGDDTSADSKLTLREALLWRRGDLGRLLTASEKGLVSGDPGFVDTVSLDVQGTITLAAELPDLSNQLILLGPAANRLAIARSPAGGTPDFRIFNAPLGANVSISGITISGGRTSTDGGGIFNAGTLALAGVTVSGNTATGFGGGIENNGGGVTIANSTVSGNSALTGGGIDMFNAGTLKLFGVTVSGNAATDNAGGINIDSSTATFFATTISNNRADSDGSGGGSSGGMLALGSDVVLRDTIVAGNFVGTGTAADNIHGTVDAANSHFNVIGTGGAGGLVNGQNANRVGIANPGLAPLAFNGGPVPTHALAPTSTARDAGTSFLTATAIGLDAVTNDFDVLDGSFLVPGAVIRIDDEEMRVVTVAGNNISVDRAVNGTAGVFHFQGASIRAGRDERGLARIKDFAGIANASGGDASDVGALEEQARVLGVGMGGQPIVKLYEADTRQVRLTINPFGVSDPNGLPFAVGDFTGDGIPDLAVARAGTVRVFDGTNGTQVKEFQPFGANYHSTLALAAADLDGDGFGDLVVGTGPGVQATVGVFSGKDWSQSWQFQPFVRFYGGLNVAADAGRIIVGTASSTSRIAVFNFGSHSKAGEFTAFVFGSAGVRVAAGDVNGDGVSDIVVSGAQGANPRVLLYRADTRTVEGQVLWTGPLGSGLRVAVADLDGDGMLDVVVAQGRYSTPLIRGYSGSSFLEVAGWQPFTSNSLGGVLVG